MLPPSQLGEFALVILATWVVPGGVTSLLARAYARFADPRPLRDPSYHYDGLDD